MTFGFWPFGRRKPAPPPIVDHRVMNEDWRSGDLARCIDGTWPFPCGCDPQREDVLRVTQVVEGVAYGTNALIYALRFEGKPQNLAWCCTAFRKLRPVNEPASDEFQQELKDRLHQPAPVEASYRPRPPFHCPTHASGHEGCPAEVSSGATGIRAHEGAAKGQQWRDNSSTAGVA